MGKKMHCVNQRVQVFRHGEGNRLSSFSVYLHCKLSSPGLSLWPPRLICIPAIRVSNVFSVSLPWADAPVSQSPVRGTGQKWLLKPLEPNLEEQVNIFISVISKQLGAELGRGNFALSIMGSKDWIAWCVSVISYLHVRKAATCSLFLLGINTVEQWSMH